MGLVLNQWQQRDIQLYMNLQQAFRMVNTTIIVMYIKHKMAGVSAKESMAFLYKMAGVSAKESMASLYKKVYNRATSCMHLFCCVAETQP